MIQYALLSAAHFLTFFGTTDANCGEGNTCVTNLPDVSASSSEIHQILQIVFAILAAIAVLMIVLAGLRFITGQGNPQDVAQARSTIIYALVGLVVALTAEAIVSLVLTRV